MSILYGLFSKIAVSKNNCYISIIYRFSRARRIAFLSKCSISASGIIWVLHYWDCGSLISIIISLHTLYSICNTETYTTSIRFFLFLTIYRMSLANTCYFLYNDWEIYSLFSQRHKEYVGEFPREELHEQKSDPYTGIW